MEDRTIPNWCANRVTFNCRDKAKLDGLEEAASNGKLLDFIVPMPKALEGTTSPSPKEMSEEEARVLMMQYGATNWYDWRLQHWGCKWDVDCEVVERISDTELYVTFDSPWGPPIEVFTHAEYSGFTIKAFYFEPGMCFVGEYADGHENSMEFDATLEGVPAEWIDEWNMVDWYDDEA